jgi:hypothetical protein
MGECIRSFRDGRDRKKRWPGRVLRRHGESVKTSRESGEPVPTSCLPSECVLCAKLGEHLYVDHSCRAEAGERELPDEFGRLKPVLLENEPVDRYRCCPCCGTMYEYRQVSDNCPTDTDWQEYVTRLEPEQAAALQQKRKETVQETNRKRKRKKG